MFARTLGFLALLTAGGLTTPAAAESHDVLKREFITVRETTCTAETAFGNFLADALKEEMAADIGLIHCAAIKGGKTYAAGTSIGAIDLAAVLPPDLKAVVLEMSGEQVLGVLEHATSALPQAADQFLQVSGLRMDVDARRAAGTRVVKLTIGGAAPEFTRTYRVALPSDMAEGAAGYGPLAQFKRATDPERELLNVTWSHLQKKGVKNAKVLGRIDIRR
jgi:5'-nucleotidase/UDP-sugar diphosphatase